MPSKESTGSFSRSVHHGNMMNKKGSNAVYQKTAQPSKLQMKLRPRPTITVQKPTKDLGDVVLKPKQTKEAKRLAKINETRFSIPDVSDNSNIANQAYVRSHTKLSVVMRELKNYPKIKSFNEDGEHEIEILK